MSKHPVVGRSGLVFAVDGGPAVRDHDVAPVAEWDFATGLESGGLVLRDGEGSAVVGVRSGIRFDGINDYLRISRADVGVLDIAQSGNAVTVVALARRASLDTGFIAGLWQENDQDPRRQYGLFLSLPTYGGSQQVIGHISADGAPSVGLPFSRDYSASARMVAPGRFRVVGFTYDGERVISFLDGFADARPTFTERTAPLGAGRTYAKNPYRYPNGLNSTATSEFTVGAVQLTKGMGNFFRGDLARLAIWDTALSASDMMAVADAWTPAQAPLLLFDFYRPAGGVDRESGGWDGDRWPLQAIGWTGGTPQTWVEAGRIVNAAGPSHVTVAGLEGLRSDAVRVEFDGNAELDLSTRNEWLAGIGFRFAGPGNVSNVRIVRVEGNRTGSRVAGGPRRRNGSLAKST